VKQLTLLGLEPVPRPAAAPPDEAAETSGSPTPADVSDDRQAALFADRPVLRREVDAALEIGAFEAAIQALIRLEEVYGPPSDGPPASCLESLAALSWGDAGAALDAWSSIMGSLCPGPRARIQAGVFTRLLEGHSPQDLVRVRPGCLPALASFLIGSARRPEGEGRRESRRLVRDALLAGRPLLSLDFQHDEAVAETLAEDMPPRWLACLGAVRRVWPVPRLSPAELLEGPTGRESRDEALAFWRCLRVAETPDCPQDLLHEARRWMKALHPGLHAILMRRATAPGGIG
jgi:hypothetical protein